MITHASPAAVQPLPPPQEAGIGKLALAVVPNVRHQPLFGIEQQLAVALDLAQRLIVMAHGGEKRRRAVDAVGPHLGCFKCVVEDAVGVARRFVQYPLEHVGRRPRVHCRIAGPRCRLRVGCASHCRVGWATTDDHAHAAVGCLLHHGGLGELDELFALA